MNKNLTWQQKKKIQWRNWSDNIARQIRSEKMEFKDRIGTSGQNDKKSV